MPDNDTSQGPISTNRRERPDGAALIALGWAGIGFGLFLFIILVVQATTPGGRDYVDGPGGIILSWIVGGLMEFGLMLLLTGLVIRAVRLIPSPTPVEQGDCGPALSE